MKSFLFSALLTLTLVGISHAQQASPDLISKHEFKEINDNYLADLAKCDALHVDLQAPCKEGLKAQAAGLIHHAAGRLPLMRREQAKGSAREEMCVNTMRAVLDKLGVSHLPKDDCEALKAKRDAQVPVE